MDDLSAPRILNGLVGTRFTHVEVHASLPSTQTLLVAEGGRDGRVVIADHQTAGRGRQGRSWLDVPGRMLMFSALLRDIAPDKAPLVSLASGVAVARAIGADARLKWPNDVRIGGRKVCGIIGELAGHSSQGGNTAPPRHPPDNYVVVGIGVNVAHEKGELPDELEATSLLIARGSAPRRDDLCVAILRALDALLSRGEWLSYYRTLCETIGARVRVELDGRVLEGEATAVDDEGALIVSGERVVAGDVVHVRS